LPIILATTMPDMAGEQFDSLNLDKLAFHLGGVPIIAINGRTGEGLDQLKNAISAYQDQARKMKFGQTPLTSLVGDSSAQTSDTLWRYARIRDILAKVTTNKVQGPGARISARLDKLFVHPLWGYVIFAAVLMVIFQFIFVMAEFPMNVIDGFFVDVSGWLQTTLPAGVLTDLLSQGVVPGIGGVVVFIPQIALLFFFLAILEESGYMARVVFIMDKMVRPFGLNGRSVVPLVSSVACAVPGIMATRTIGNWKDRMITIMVAPLMSCSARIPVYTLLIALVIPNDLMWGWLDLQGLTLFGLYLLGLVSALLVAGLFRIFLSSTERSFLLMELPNYQIPRWREMLITVWEKVRIFVVDAGKVILAIAIVLWALCSYGPPERMEKALTDVEVKAADNITPDELEQKLASTRLENSFIGIAGQWMEPAIRPLGYDWKIGIALLTSFAAREIFVGSMAAIYSVGADFEDGKALMDRMRDEVNPTTGKPVYTLASGLSLMVFYVYAMQCMSTLAVVKRETGSWKWPLIQLLYMGVLAWLSAFILYQTLS
ncbi:MAG: ferrous iron transport protein, partial [Bacteroidota bacterium]